VERITVLVENFALWKVCLVLKISTFPSSTVIGVLALSSGDNEHCMDMDRTE